MNQNAKTILSAIAGACDARRRCLEKGSGLPDAGYRWDAYLDAVERQCLPRGSGFDCGTKIDREKSGAGIVVLVTEFHHMDEHGGYDGWTAHVIRMRPTFVGPDITISGRDRNGFKDHCVDVFLSLAYDAIPDSIKF